MVEIIRRVTGPRTGIHDRIGVRTIRIGRAAMTEVAEAFRERGSPVRGIGPGTP